ncbi:unnamed protein product, partial [Allacma fusca]
PRCKKHFHTRWWNFSPSGPLT